MDCSSGYRASLAREWLGAITAALLLTSCGGGGGGGSGSSSSGGSGLRFTLDRSSISFDYLDTAAPAAQIVVATAIGTLPNSLFIGAQDQSANLEPQIVTTLTGTEARFEILPRAGLAPGTYVGTVHLLACVDQVCSRQLGNSPLAVAYSIRVRPGLRIRPENPGLTTYTSGQEGVVQFTVQLPEDATSYAASTVNGGSMCRIDNQTATTFDLIASSVPAGDFLCQFRVDAGTRFDVRSVNFHVDAPAGGQRNLAVVETGLTFSTVEGAASGAQRLHVIPSSWDSDIGIEAQSYGGNGSDWLRFSSASDGFDVRADAIGLSEGTYFASVRVFGRSPHFSQEVIVPMSVTVGPGLVRPADIMPTITSETTAAELRGSTPIQLAGGPSVSWTASSNASWLTLTRSAGMTGSSLEFDYDNAAFHALANGRSHGATITVSTANPVIAPVQFQVRVDKRIAQVTGLGPYLQLSNSSVHAYVRGVGFSSLTTPGRLQAAGLPNAVFTPINDTTVLMQHPPAPAGAYWVGASNALGVAVETRTLKVIDPVTMTYAAFPTGLPVGSVVYDAERQTLYVSTRGPTADRMYRFRREGTSWVAGMTPGASDYNIGMTNDGTRLVITEPPYTVRFLDAATFAGAGTHTLTTGRFQGGAANGREVAVANDGRIWLGPDNFGLLSRTLTTFDPLFDEFGAFDLPGSGVLTSATFEVPRDGARLIIGEIDGSQYRAGVLDSHSAAYTPAAGVTDFLFKMHSSADGSRTSVGGQVILDGDLQPFANVYEALRLRNDWVVTLALLSPDGSRAYALAFDPTDYYHFNDPPPAPHSRPRIYVIDTSATAPTPNTASVVGYFEIDDYPICRTQSGCDLQTRGTISPDGRTLFFAGQDRLVVVPVPAENTLVTTGNLPAPTMKLWVPKAGR